MRKSSSPSFYDKLTSQRHLDLHGVETYSTHPGLHGVIVCRHAGQPDHSVMLVRDKKGFIELWDMTAKRSQQTFVRADNCCAEELHKTLELFTRTPLV